MFLVYIHKTIKCYWLYWITGIIILLFLYPLFETVSRNASHQMVQAIQVLRFHLLELEKVWNYLFINIKINVFLYHSAYDLHKNYLQKPLIKWLIEFKCLSIDMLYTERCLYISRCHVLRYTKLNSKTLLLM